MILGEEPYHTHEDNSPANLMSSVMNICQDSMPMDTFDGGSSGGGGASGEW